MRLTQVVPVESYTVSGLYTESFHGKCVFVCRIEMHFYYTIYFIYNKIYLLLLFRYIYFIYLKPKVTLHFELPNISLLFLILTKLNIAISCLYPP